MTTKTPKARKVKAKDIPIYWAASKIKLEPERLERLGKVLGFEGGNGKCALVYLNEDSEIVRSIMPNARMMISGQQTERAAGAVMRVPFAEFQGTRWAYSDAIFNIPGGRVDAFQGSEERYGSAEHIFSLLVMMAENDLPDGAYRLLVTVPPGFYSQVESRVIQRFMAGDPLKVNKRDEPSGVWQITLSKDNIRRTYSFSNVKVIMEAADAGYAAFCYDLNGNIVRVNGPDGQDLLSGMVRLLDAGFGTFDSPTLFDGQLIEDRLQSASDSRGGIMHNLARPLIDKIIETQPQVGSWLTPAHVDYWLRRYATGYTDANGNAVTGWTEASGTVSIGGKAIGLKAMIDHLSQEYARTYIWPKIVGTPGDAVDALIAIGGGWLYTHSTIQQWHREYHVPTRFISYLDFPHLKKFSWVDINLVGIMQVAALIDWSK